MSATARARTAHGIANGHWEPTERKPFKIFKLEGSTLGKLLRFLVREPATAEADHGAANDLYSEKHAAAE